MKILEVLLELCGIEKGIKISNKKNAVGEHSNMSNFYLTHFNGIPNISYRYDGTPLQLEDERLGEIVKWIKRHDLSIVKLDCSVHKVTKRIKIVSFELNSQMYEKTPNINLFKLMSNPNY